MDKVVLAFSGGLDTSYCAVYLSRVKHLEVHAVTVNTGGFSDEELVEIERVALELGVKSFTVLNELPAYYDQIVKYLVFGNVLKNNTYPLSVSAERVCQARAIAAYARQLGATYVAHGSTGAGNDQVRFDMVFQILIPDVQIITPIRDLKLSRQDEIDFLHGYGVHIDFRKAAYSVNKGLWGTSVGGKETLTSHMALPEEAYPSSLTREDTRDIILSFEKGELKEIDGKVYAHSVDAILVLQEIASAYAIGRDVHIGDTIIGIKGRVGFEAAAPMIIIKAHHNLEKHVLSKYQLMIKDQLAMWYGNWLHEGLFFDPVMRDIETLLQHSQEYVSGKVFVRLMPYRFLIQGLESPNDLMSSRFGAYGEMNNTWTGEDVRGFSKIFSNSISIYHKVHQAYE